MEAIAAVFDSAERARAAVESLRARGVRPDRLTLLLPGVSAREIEGKVPTDEGEPPGMGGAVGGVVGGALGLATATLVLPGVGPVVVAGMLAAGIAGAAAGGAVGDELERRLSTGLPRDELAVYKEAIRQGHAVVIVGAETETEAEMVRATLRGAGAQTVDPAREDWLVGLRDTVI